MHGHDTVLRAGHPRRVGLDIDRHRTQVERSPSAPTLAGVIAAAAALTDPAATTRCTHQAHMANHRPAVLVELDLLNDRLIDAQNSTPYPGVAHAVLRSPVADPRQASNLSGKGESRDVVGFEVVGAAPVS
jgi:hypothetical protein